MKPIRLEIDGINSYGIKQVVDFEKLTSKGLFGIFGKTGSGKSTILDAITLALYGNIARGTREFVNSNCKKGSVEYEFEIVQQGKRNRYIVKRRFKKNKDNGNAQSDYTMLQRLNEDGDYEVVEEGKVSEVNKRIKSIIGLEESDFLRSVVLPQGKFSEFLTLGGKDRRNMLERIFRLEEYGSRLSAKIVKKKSSTIKEVDILEARMNEYPNISTENRDNLKKIVDSLGEEIKEIIKKLELESKIQEKNEKIYSLLVEKEEVEKRLAKLKGREEYIKTLTEKLENAEKANIVIPEIQKEKNIAIEIIELEKEESKIKNLLEDKNSDLKYKKEEFDEIKEKREKVEYIANVRNTIVDILSLKSKAVSNKNNIVNIEKRIKEIEENKKSIQKEVKKAEEQLENIKNEGKKKNEEIKNNSITAKYRSLVKSGIDVHREMYKQEKSIEKNIDKIKELNNGEGGITSIKKKIEALEEIIGKADEEIGKIIDAISVQDKIETLSDEDLEKLSTSLNNIENKIINLKEDEKSILSIEESIGKEQEAILLKMKKIESIKSKLKDMNNKLISLEKKDGENSIKKLSDEIRIIWSKDFHKGDLCPVCNNAVEKIEIQEHIGDEYEKNREDIKAVQTEISNLNVEIAKVDTELKNSEEKIKELKLKKKEIVEKNKGITVKELSDKKAKYESIREEQRSLIKIKKDEIERLKKEKEIADKNKLELEKKHIVYEQSISSINKSIKLIEEGIENFKKENENSKKEIDKICFEIKSTDEFKNSSIEKIEREFFIEENKRIDASTVKVEALSKELEAINKNIENEEKKLKKNSEELVAIENILVKTNSEKESLGKQIEELRKEAMEKKNYIDFKELDSILQFEYDSLDSLPGIMDSFIRIVKENYEEISKAFESLKKEILTLDKNAETNQVRLEILRKSQKEQFERVESFMKKFGFTEKEAISNLCMDDDVLEMKKKEVESFNEEQKKYQIVYRDIDKKLEGRSITKEEKENQEAVKKEIEEVLENKKSTFTEEQYKLNEMEKNLILVKEIETKLKEKQKLLDNIKEIDRLFQGNRFVEYLSQIYLNNIIIDASERLRDITNGRYTLEMSENYLFVISDNFNGGIRRAADTLSGGEVFLTSLSLALALSSQIQLKGSAPLEFFFLDEGFGTLDSALLDTVMTSLENLKSDNLSVGIISHVEEIKARIPLKLEIEMNEVQQSSIIREVEE